MKRQYSDDELRMCFEFTQRNFERFLELLRWFDSLEPHEVAEQTDSLWSVYGHHAKGKKVFIDSMRLEK